MDRLHHGFDRANGLGPELKHYSQPLHNARLQKTDSISTTSNCDLPSYQQHKARLRPPRESRWTEGPSCRLPGLASPLVAGGTVLYQTGSKSDKPLSQPTPKIAKISRIFSIASRTVTEGTVSAAKWQRKITWEINVVQTRVRATWVVSGKIRMCMRAGFANPHATPVSAIATSVMPGHPTEGKGELIAIAQNSRARRSIPHRALAAPPPNFLPSRRRREADISDDSADGRIPP